MRRIFKSGKFWLSLVCAAAAQSEEMGNVLENISEMKEGAEEFLEEYGRLYQSAGHAVGEIFDRAEFKDGPVLEFEEKAMPILKTAKDVRGKMMGQLASRQPWPTGDVDELLKLLLGRYFFNQSILNYGPETETKHYAPLTANMDNLIHNLCKYIPGMVKIMKFEEPRSRWDLGKGIFGSVADRIGDAFEILGLDQESLKIVYTELMGILDLADDLASDILPYLNPTNPQMPRNIQALLRGPLTVSESKLGVAGWGSRILYGPWFSSGKVLTSLERSRLFRATAKSYSASVVRIHKLYCIAHLLLRMEVLVTLDLTQSKGYLVQLFSYLEILRNMNFIIHNSLIFIHDGFANLPPFNVLADTEDLLDRPVMAKALEEIIKAQVPQGRKKDTPMESKNKVIKAFVASEAFMQLWCFIYALLDRDAVKPIIQKDGALASALKPIAYHLFLVRFEIPKEGEFDAWIKQLKTQSRPVLTKETVKAATTTV